MTLTASRKLWVFPLYLVAALAGAVEGAGTASTTTGQRDIVARRLDLATLRKLRQKAAHHHRRMIFNNDGDDVLLAAEPTSEGLLVQRTSALAGTQVDSIFYCGCVCFGNARYNSSAWEAFTSREGWFKDHNSLPQFLAKGIDPMKVMVSFCHAHGMEMFWDMRVNDTHDAGLDADGQAMRPRFKREHPDYLVGSPDKPPPYGTWSSVNFAVPQVRDAAYRFIEEACRNYDIDGISLDFLRHACFFKSVAWGGKASREELDMMTDLIRRTRQMTEREGMRRGRPLLFAIRVPDSVEYCKDIGLEVDKWLAEGLVDILIGTCYFQLNPWEYLVQLGHRYGVSTYASLSESRVAGETRFNRNSLESYRARAMQAWGAGADGIYMFNYFWPQGPIWRELGELRTLRGKDKLYFASPRNGSPEAYLAGGRQYQHVPILTPDNPWPLPDDRPLEVELPVAEDLQEAQRSGLKTKATCHLRRLGGHSLAVSLNGKSLGSPNVTDDWLDFAVPLSLLKKGANRFSIAAPQRAAATTDSQWDIVYEGSKPPTSPWHRDGFFAGGLVVDEAEGKLFIADRSTETGSYAYFYCPCSIRPEVETVVEARLKTIEGSSSVIVENGSTRLILWLSPRTIWASSGGLSCAMSTGDAFHTYRIVLLGKDFRVYADGKLRLDGTGRLTDLYPGIRSGVWFGASNSNTMGEALWESVKIRNHTISLIDMVLSIRYGER